MVSTKNLLIGGAIIAAVYFYYSGSKEGLTTAEDARKRIDDPQLNKEYSWGRNLSWDSPPLRTNPKATFQKKMSVADVKKRLQIHDDRNNAGRDGVASRPKNMPRFAAPTRIDPKALAVKATIINNFVEQA